MQILYRGTYIDIARGIKIKDLLKGEIEKSEIDVIACKYNNEIKSLNDEINCDGELDIINIGTKDGMRIYRRGLIYIVAKAIEEVYPEALFTVNYQLHHALLCEIENMEITEEVINNIDKRVTEIINADLPIVKTFMTKEEAKEFYENTTTLKGKLQLELDSKEEVTLYHCEDYYNYFYGVMPISTGYIKHYELMKYDGRLLVRFPSSKTPTIIDEFDESPKLLEALDEYEDVHKILEVNTLYKLNTIIRQGKIREYISLDEALHEKKIAGIADDIVKNRELKVILIAGPSSSGKTTFAKRLEIQLRLNRTKTANNISRQLFCRKVRKPNR